MALIKRNGKLIRTGLSTKTKEKLGIKKPKSIKKAVTYPIHFNLLNKVCKGWIREHKFSKTRQWRFDFCHPDLKIAIEIDGGVWSGGRHTRGAGFVKDLEKLNQATILGWKVLRYTPEQIGEMEDDVKELTKS